MKRHIVISAKFFIAFGLIIWLIYSGKLSINNVQGAFTHPLFLISGVSCIILIKFLSMLRWHFLLKAQDVDLQLFETVKLSLIGIFFSTMLPGGVSGDVVKAYYITRKEKEKKVQVLLAIGIDRVFGLISIFPIALIAIGVNWKKISATPELLYMAEFIGLSILIFFVIIPVILSDKIKKHPIMVKFLNKIPFSGIINDFYNALHQFKCKLRLTLIAFITSLGIPIVLGLAFYFFGICLGEMDVKLMDYYFILPFVTLSLVIPIAPSGVGIGQVTALTLLNWIKGYESTFGADMMTLFHIFRFLIALCGGFIYIIFKQPVNLSDVETKTQAAT